MCAIANFFFFFFRLCSRGGGRWWWIRQKTHAMNWRRQLKLNEKCAVSCHSGYLLQGFDETQSLFGCQMCCISWMKIAHTRDCTCSAYREFWLCFFFYSFTEKCWIEMSKISQTHVSSLYCSTIVEFIEISLSSTWYWLVFLPNTIQRRCVSSIKRTQLHTRCCWDFEDKSSMSEEAKEMGEEKPQKTHENWRSCTAEEIYNKMKKKKLI